MGCLTCLTDPKALVVADASAIINLNATGRAPDIIRALPNRVVVVDVVSAELEQGRRRGRPDADLLNQLVNATLIEIVRLNEPAVKHFEELVIGSAAKTLDDGEAATIAYAVGNQATALVDERKATRICAGRFPKLCLGCTVDIFTHPDVLRVLGAEALAAAVFGALYHGRMRVFPHHIDWVVDLTGTNQAALCTSLPASVRAKIANVANVQRQGK